MTHRSAIAAPAKAYRALFLIVSILWTQTSVAAELEAVLQWSRLHVVGFPVDGGVIAVHARPGDRVSKGDKLIELNPEPAEYRVRQYEAELASTKPALTDAGREYEHAQSLYEQTVLSDVELQKTRLAYEKAQADVAAARARLDLARWKLASKTAYAPWDGVVVERDIEVGDMLIAEQRSKRWMVLARTDVMAARASITVSAMVSLRVGDKVRVEVAGKSYDATIIEIGYRQPDSDSASLLVEFRPAEQGTLVPGMPASVELSR